MPSLSTGRSAGTKCSTAGPGSRRRRARRARAPSAHGLRRGRQCRLPRRLRRSGNPPPPRRRGPSAEQRIDGAVVELALNRADVDGELLAGLGLELFAEQHRQLARELARSRLYGDRQTVDRRRQDALEQRPHQCAELLQNRTRPSFAATSMPFFARLTAPFAAFFTAFTMLPKKCSNPGATWCSEPTRPITSSISASVNGRIALAERLRGALNEALDLVGQRREAHPGGGRRESRVGAVCREQAVSPTSS